METSESTPEHVKEWSLEAGTEYRFELDPGVSLAVKLVSGLAEIFGAELAEGKTYLFGSECKAAIFTWQGCVLEVIGRPSTEYVSEETPMNSYANLHLAFEQMRVRARQEQRGSPPPPGSIENITQPPRILLLGPENSGKTTACKILANYCVRAGQSWSPILVNLDPGEGGWTVPGTISTCPVNMPIPTSSPENPLGSSATSAPTALTSSALLPLVYWFGHVETRRNPKLMDRLIRTLAGRVHERIENDKTAAVSGIIIDTPASFSTSTNGKGAGEKYAHIKTCVEVFKINALLVIGHEKLNVEMRREFGSSLSVVKIPKSGGVVELDFAYRARVHSLQLHSYLYGQALPLPRGVSSATLGGEALNDLSLSPHSSVVDFSDLKIYRIGGEVMAPSSALPIGASRVVSEMQPVLVDPTQSGSGLLNAVLALLVVSDLPPSDDNAILDCDVAGFIVVMSMDMEARKMTVLSPSPGSLQDRIAIIGSLEWQEQ